MPYTKCKLGNVAVSIKRKSDSKDYPIMMISSTDGFINQIDRYSKDNAGSSKSKYTLLYFSELSYNHGNSKTKRFGSIFALKEPAALVPFVYHSFKIEKQNPFYFARYLNLPMHDRYLIKVISSGARMDGLLNINSKDFFNMPIQFPNLDEQNYIESFFNLIDNKILIIQKKLQALKKYKKGITQKVLKNSINYWKYGNGNALELANFLTEEKEFAENVGFYNHVTLSKEGIHDKTDRYNRDFLVKNENKMYKVTHFNQLCYNPANLKFGVICINKYGDGIFSPIYVTFKVKNIDLEYFETIVTSDDFIRYTMKFQQGTVYERMSVSPEDLCKIKIVVSGEQNQKLSSTTISLLNKKITKLEYELQKLKHVKNKLLNDMFI